MYYHCLFLSLFVKLIISYKTFDSMNFILNKNKRKKANSFLTIANAVKPANLNKDNILLKSEIVGNSMKTALPQELLLFNSSDKNVEPNEGIHHSNLSQTFITNQLSVISNSNLRLS